MTDELDDISWERVIEEALKKPDDPIAQMFLGVYAEIAELKELAHRAYYSSDIRLKNGWVIDYKRLVREK